MTVKSVELMSHFIKHANTSRNLLLDNHTSPLNVETTDMAIAHGITMVRLSHESHRIQPLEVSYFGLFKFMN